MSGTIIRCKNCGKVVPQIKADTFGRRPSRIAEFCRNNRKCYFQYYNNSENKKFVNRRYYDSKRQ